MLNYATSKNRMVCYNAIQKHNHICYDKDVYYSDLCVHGGYDTIIIMFCSVMSTPPQQLQLQLLQLEPLTQQCNALEGRQLSEYSDIHLDHDQLSKLFMTPH